MSRFIFKINFIRKIKKNNNKSASCDITDKGKIVCEKASQITQKSSLVLDAKSEAKIETYLSQQYGITSFPLKIVDKWTYLGNTSLYQKVEIIKYPTQKFIDDLKEEIQIILPISFLYNELKDSHFSRILGKNDKYIYAFIHRSTHNIKDLIKFTILFEKVFREPLSKDLTDSINYWARLIKRQIGIDSVSTIENKKEQKILYIKMLEDLREILFPIVTIGHINKATNIRNEENPNLEQLPLIRIAHELLDNLIGMREGYISETIFKLKNNSPNFLFSKDNLSSFYMNLEKNLSNLNLIKVKRLFSLFCSENKDIIPLTDRGIKKHHPNFNDDYFKTINSKEKAYMLGIIYSEAGFHQTHKKDPKYLNFSIELEMMWEARNLVEAFHKILGLNKFYGLYKNIRYMYVDSRLKVKEYVRSQFQSKKMVSDLINLGILSSIGIYKLPITPVETMAKSLTIRLPNLGDIIENRDLYLAFLLAFWDGEGHAGTSDICSGSFLMLDDIKEIFNLNSVIKGRYDDRHDSTTYTLSLGKHLMREMLRNYQGIVPDFYKRKSLYTLRLNDFKKSITNWYKKEKRNLVGWEKQDIYRSKLSDDQKIHLKNGLQDFIECLGQKRGHSYKFMKVFILKVLPTMKLIYEYDQIMLDLPIAKNWRNHGEYWI